jgi:hypothetical protein
VSVIDNVQSLHRMGGVGGRHLSGIFFKVNPWAPKFRGSGTEVMPVKDSHANFGARACARRQVHVTGNIFDMFRSGPCPLHATTPYCPKWSERSLQFP